MDGTTILVNPSIHILGNSLAQEVVYTDQTLFYKNLLNFAFMLESCHAFLIVTIVHKFFI